MDQARSGPLVLGLTAASALSVTSIALTVAASPLVGYALAPRPGLATLPLSLQILGTMAASVPASLLMGRIGRRPGFVIGTLIGMLGAGLATWAILHASFPLFVVGSLGIGILNGFAQFYRFTAAEVAGAEQRARAISLVLAGGVVAGVLGPGLASSASGWIASARFAGSYAAIVGLNLLILLILAFTKLPRRQPQADDSVARPLRQIAVDRRFVAAVGAAAVAYFSMSLVMTAAPLSIVSVGFPFSTAAVAIQAHVVAMFLPSFWTGRLIDRFGAGAVKAAGAAALVGTVVVHLSGTAVGHYVVGLVLLGVGWNFLFIAGTTIVAGLHTPTEQSKVQGLNDVIVFGGAATGSFLAGALLETIGWRNLHLGLGVLLLVAIAAYRLVRPKVPILSVPASAIVRP